MTPVTYQISEADYLAFWKLGTESSFRKVMIGLGLYLLLVIGVYAFLAPTDLVLWIGGAVAAFMAFVALQRLVGAPRMLRLIYREDAGIKEQVTLTFDEDCFIRSFASGTVSSRWDDMVKWHENDAIFAIFPNRQIGHIIPKHSMSEEAISAMKAHLIKSGLPDQNRLRK